MSSSPGPPQASGRRIRAGGGRDDSHRRGGGGDDGAGHLERKFCACWEVTRERFLRQSESCREDHSRQRK